MLNPLFLFKDVHKIPLNIDILSEDDEVQNVMINTHPRPYLE